MDKFLSGVICVDPALRLSDFLFVGMKKRFGTGAELSGESGGGRRRGLRDHLEKHARGKLGRYGLNKRALLAPEAPHQHAMSLFPIQHQNYDHSPLR